MNVVIKIYRVLTPRMKRAFPWLVLAFVLNSVLEVTGVASVLPFMLLVADPNNIEKHAVLANVQSISGLTSPRDFILAIGVGVLALLALGNLFSIVLFVISVRLLNREAADLSSQLLRRYIGQPYIWFLSQNTTVLGRNVLAEVTAIPTGIVLPLLRLVSKALAAAMIMAGLLYVNAAIAVITGLLLGGSYGLIWLFTKDRLTQIGNRRLEAEGLKYRSAAEALGGIKTTMVLGRERFFLERYNVSAQKLGVLQSEQGVLNETPRYLLEILAFGSVICIILVQIIQGKNLTALLPIISIFTLGAYRLMPALQQGFSYISSIRCQLPALHYLYDELQHRDQTVRDLTFNEARLPLRERIQLNNITFAYPGKASPVLNGLSLEIPKNSCIGLVGSTGAGKTTLVDILLGLLEPNAGSITVDGTPVQEHNLRLWQNAIGYVSQDIYLTDDTILANIALGIPPGQIDRAAVVSAAKLANLHEFVQGELPESYDTKVGERGFRLSGGQRQRIGIARALYHSPELLVLDEATSSLDGITETAVMDAVHNLSQKMTIIMIAHRLSTIQECDCIYFLKQGSVVDQGTFADLMARNSEFRDMARASKAPEPEPSCAV